jgi:SAM-dependent methyltransferase
MSHKQQIEFVSFVKKQYPKYFDKSTVLEIGSLDINGSVRPLFTNCAYIGLDIATGPGVDVVGLGHEYDMPTATFDCVISCECFEHDPFYEKTFLNMLRLCKPGGLIIFSCATVGRAEHGTSCCEPRVSPLTVAAGWDYYKNLTEKDFRKICKFESEFKQFEFSTNTIVHDLYFYGIRV